MAKIETTQKIDDNMLQIYMDDGSYFQVWIGNTHATLSYAPSPRHYQTQLDGTRYDTLLCDLIPNCD